MTTTKPMTTTTTMKKKNKTSTTATVTATKKTKKSTAATSTKPSSKKELFNEIFSNDAQMNDYDPEDAFNEDDDKINRRNNSKQYGDDDDAQQQQQRLKKSSSSSSKGLLLRTQADLDESLTRGTYSGHSVNRQDLFDNDDDFDQLQSEEYLHELKQAQRALELEKQGFGGEGSDDEDSDSDDGAGQLQSHLDQMAVDNKAVIESIQKDRLKQKRRAQCVFNQRLLYDQLLKARILLQKPLATCNQLPQPDTFFDFLEHEDQLSTECSQTRAMLFEMLSDLLDMQHELFTLNDACKNADCRTKKISGKSLADIRAKKKRKIDSENNSSGVDNEGEEDDLIQEVWKVVNSSYDIYSDYRAEALEKWNMKTRMQSALNTKQFKSMNAGIMTQVQNALKDDRMRQRAQMKRFPERILGKRARDNEDEVDEEQEEETVDQELFDDKDFFQVLLRDFIQDVGASAMSKSGGNLVSALQKNAKSNKKRRQPIGQTKDRSIVYKVHEKLVNFMTPTELEIPKSAETLFAHLFGGGTVEIEDDDSEDEELKQTV